MDPTLSLEWYFLLRLHNHTAAMHIAANNRMMNSPRNTPTTTYTRLLSDVGVGAGVGVVPVRAVVVLVEKRG